MARLGDVCEVINGFAFKSEQYVDSGIRIIRIANVQKGYLEDAAPVFYPSESKEAKKYSLVEDDILMSLTGNVGRVAKLSREFLPAALNQRVACLRIKDGADIDKAFLFNLLNSDYFEQQCISASKGVAQKNMSTEWLKEYEIPIFSLERQRLIAGILDKTTELISLRKQQLAKLDELVKARFVELFGAVSAEKCTKRINDYAEVLGGFAFKSDLFCSNAIPVIRISNINNGCIELDYNTCFEESFWEQNKKFRAKRNDILMAMSGATTGKAGIFKEDMPALINQRVACIRAKDGIACPMFLFVATQLEWMYDLIQETSAGCAQPNISGKQIENMPVPDVTYEQQRQFATFVEHVDKSKSAVQQSIDQLETLKKSLMQKYFG